MSAGESMARRTDDEMQKKISQMIEEEQDPKGRSHLLIQFHIATLLIDTVRIVSAQSDEFRTHRQEYEAHAKREENFFAQGRGAWRVSAIVLICAQSILGYMYIKNAESVDALQKASVVNAKDIAEIKERNRIEERIRTQ